MLLLLLLSLFVVVVVVVVVVNVSGDDGDVFVHVWGCAWTLWGLGRPLLGEYSLVVDS